MNKRNEYGKLQVVHVLVFSIVSLALTE